MMAREEKLDLSGPQGLLVLLAPQATVVPKGSAAQPGRLAVSARRALRDPLVPPLRHRALRSCGSWLPRWSVGCRSLRVRGVSLASPGLRVRAP